MGEKFFERKQFCLLGKCCAMKYVCCSLYSEAIKHQKAFTKLFIRYKMIFQDKRNIAFYH